MNKNVKELFLYLSIFLILVVIVIMNKVFCKFGKQDNIKSTDIYLKSNNVTYDVPYSEEVLD
ncbi:MAG: hypothetical protein HFJ49_01335 [Clostridia bacterium]|nr:hypothetical protein [Clostridia bacterium]